MKCHYKHIIFDLDGTLSDSREGIFKAYYHTAKELNLRLPPEEKLESLIGPPLQRGFAEVFGLSGEIMDRAIHSFRQYYGEKGLFENRLYDGIAGLLEDLSKAGANIYVATAKYEVYANQVLQYFSILPFIHDMAGADYDGTHANKISLISGLLQRNGITRPEEVIIIGDTSYDIEAAAELDIESIGVSYGFSSYHEMENLNPDYIARTVDELRSLLLYTDE